MQIDQFLSFFLEHKGTISSFLLGLITVLKLTSWGRAKAAALDAVIAVIERLGNKDVKTGVAQQENLLDSGAKDAIQHAVAKIDPKKKPEGTGTRIFKELLRGILTRK